MSFFKKIGNSIADFFTNLWKNVCAKLQSARKAIKKDPKVILEKTRTVAFVLIIFVMAIAGIYFILKADQELKSRMWKVTKEIKKLNVKDKETGELVNQANQAIILGQSKSLSLMIAIILAFGSSIVSAFSEMKKSNKVLVYILKAIALVLAVGFVVFVMKFDTWYLTNEGIKVFADYKPLALVIGYLGIGLIVVNIVSNAILGIEE